MLTKAFSFIKNSKQYSIIFLAATVVGCSSNPHKAEKIETNMDKSKEINGETKVGLKDGNMIVQRKVDMAEELRNLQNEVYSTEDRVYGNRKYGSSGLYGVLKNCKLETSDIKNGGDGKLQWTEPIDRVTEKEEEFIIGIDEKDNLVGVSEEFLKDRIQRFREYKRILNKRQDEYEEKISICKLELKTRQVQTKTSN